MATTTPSATALTFQSTRFDIVARDGQPWLRCPQIGDALGYAKRSGIAIDALYKRNKAEFTDRMTAVVKLPTAGGFQDTRIFSLRGAHLLGMFARTARAAEFRRWVLDVLEQQEAKPAVPALPAKDARVRRWLLCVKDGDRPSCVELDDDVQIVSPYQLAEQAHQARIAELRKTLAAHEQQAKDHRNSLSAYEKFAKPGDRTKWLSHIARAATADWYAEDMRDQLRALGAYLASPAAGKPC